MTNYEIPLTVAEAAELLPKPRTLTIGRTVYTVEPNDGPHADRVPYRITGPRGAVYFTMRNVNHPDQLFLVTHALLTPPGADRTDLDNLGVFQMACWPPFAQRLFDAMAAEGWLVSFLDEQPDVPADWPPRVRGQGYVDAFIDAHPGLI